ncbi:hypothetical protein [Streptomyces microflavus]|uniref:hypothetical protein n=1 Tax=Streptomyces microflavus TaxID=1919 RepID=UPI003F4D71CC
MIHAATAITRPRGPGGPGRRRLRWRSAALAAVMLLCTAPLASATDGAAEGRPPAHGAAALYVSDYADNEVLRVPPGGGEPTTVAADGLTRPTGMVLDASGDLYIADTGNNRVVRVPGDGGPQTVVPTTGLSRPIGLALDAAGTLYIADSFNDRVVKVPADGSGQVTVPTTGLLHPTVWRWTARGTSSSRTSSTTAW